MAKSERWRVVENVVAAIERVRGTSAGWTVRQNAMVEQRDGSPRRQVDVFVECPSGEEVFRVAIDVKDEAAPLDIEKMEQLCAKGGKLAVDRYAVVSTSGFTKPAQEEAARKGVQTQTMEALNASDLFALDHVNITQPCLRQVTLLYEEGAERPQPECLPNAWIEDEIACMQIPRLVLNYVNKRIAELAQSSSGVMHEFLIEDADHHWQQLRADGRCWPPPTHIRVHFEIAVTPVPANKFRTPDGREAFSAQLPSGPDGELQQVTFVTVPEESGGFRIAVSTAPVKPPREKV